MINSNFSVTLRVHPETLKRENKILSQIIKRFSDSPKFNLNVDLNDISSFENSEMLVTDNGGVGLEYGLIYEKPTLYINYIEKIHNSNYKDLDIEPFEDKFKRKFGYQLNISDIDQLNKKIKKIKETFDYQSSGIQEFFINNGLKTYNASSTATDIIKKILQ